MNWIKDKKNLPKVLAVATFVIVIAGGAVAWELIQNKANAPTPVTTGMATPVPGAPGGYPGTPGAYPGGPGRYPGTPGAYPGGPGGPMAARNGLRQPGRPGMPMASQPGNPAARHAPGMPGVMTPAQIAANGLRSGRPLTGPASAGASAQAGGVKVASAAPTNVATGPDPFNLPKEYWIKTGKIRPAKKGGRDVFVPPLIIADVSALPPVDAALMPATTATAVSKTLARTQNQPRRMAGVVFADNGVYAVLDTSGSTQMVQPGDRVNGGKVISIQSDGLTIRTDDNRDVKVPLASSAPGDAGNQQGGYPGAPGGYPGAPGGYPGAPGAYPGAPGGYPGAPGAYPGGYPGGPPTVDNSG